MAKKFISKTDLLEKVREHASASEGFLMNDCGGVDLVMDAVNRELGKMGKKQLLALWEIAKKDEYFVGEDY